MKIGIYNQTVTYKTGGTESYTAFLLQSIQNMYPYAEITIISEENKSMFGGGIKDVLNHLNSTFGTNIKNNNILIKELKYCNRIAFFILFYKESSKYDLFFNCSVNMLCPNAKINIQITHFPDHLYKETHFSKMCFFTKVLANKIDKRIKNSYSLYLCNSEFTAHWLKVRWNIENKRIKILYPPVNLVKGQEKKDNIIMVCSRIESSKKIEFLIEAFNKINVTDYKLVIAGGCSSDSDKTYLKKLKSLIKDNNSVEFMLNISRSKLEKLYKRAKIFWHAKGFDIDEDKNPYMLEHFGITTVEAMSAGCVPIVIDKGGQKEIVDENFCGFRWKTTDELVKKTQKIINNSELFIQFSNAAISKATVYSSDSFCSKLKNIISSNIFL